MINYHTHTLANGLKVILHKDQTTPLVSLNILYNVGSKHEKENLTGFAHLFEHLMFGGSIHIPDYDTPLEKAGGENNAFTNQDFTNYYLTIPAINLETALWLESDRMLSLAFTQHSLDVQKKVVIEEFKERYLNKPYGDIYHIFYDMIFKTHPYKWPTIGKTPEHIEKATLDNVKDFFFSHYAPNNAILTLAGNIDYKKTLDLIEKWFGDIPRRDIAHNPISKEPPQEKERRKTVYKNVPFSKIIIGYHMPARTHKDYYVYDLLSDILANGRSARFFKNLIKPNTLFTKADAYISGNIDTGIFYIDTLLKKEADPQEAEKNIYKELEKIINGNISEEEINRMKNKYEVSYAFEMYELSSRSFYLSYYELLNDLSLINKEVELYKQVTKQDIIRVAKELFSKENRTVLYYLSKKY